MHPAWGRATSSDRATGRVRAELSTSTEEETLASAEVRAHAQPAASLEARLEEGAG